MLKTMGFALKNDAGFVFQRHVVDCSRRHEQGEHRSKLTRRGPLQPHVRQR